MASGGIYTLEKTSKKHVVQDSFGNNVTVRSKLEIQIAELLNENEVTWAYEVTTIPYVVPASNHKYTVDFTVQNGILIEGKGYLSDYAERNKYVLLKQQHPDLDLRFVFANPNKLCGGTKMPHWKWAEKYGFRWCSVTDHEQIRAWVKEKNK
jgi:hypothetical protein